MRAAASLGWTLVMVCATSCSLSLMRPAQAADATLPPGLVMLLQRPEHRGELLAAAQSANQALPQPCKTGSYATTGEIGMLMPLKLDGDGKPVAGAWKEAITETGCGPARQLNALTVVQADGRLVSYPMLPGTTITDPELQHDSVQYAAAGMGAMPPGCDRGGVVDTSFVGVDGAPPGMRPEPGSDPKPWTERWTLQACSKRVVVGMKFTPDATGTGIEAIPPKP